MGPCDLRTMDQTLGLESGHLPPSFGQAAGAWLSYLANHGDVLLW